MVIALMIFVALELGDHFTCTKMSNTAYVISKIHELGVAPRRFQEFQVIELLRLDDERVWHLHSFLYTVWCPCAPAPPTSPFFLCSVH